MLAAVIGAAILSSLQEVTTQGIARRERRSNVRFIIFVMVVCL